MQIKIFHSDTIPRQLDTIIRVLQDLNTVDQSLSFVMINSPKDAFTRGIGAEGEAFFLEITGKHGTYKVAGLGGLFHVLQKEGVL